MKFRPWLMAAGFAGAGCMALPVGSSVTDALASPSVRAGDSTATVRRGAHTAALKRTQHPRVAQERTDGPEPASLAGRRSARHRPGRSSGSATSLARLGPSTGRTRLEAREAARLLAVAWQASTGTVASAETLGVLLAHWAFETGRGQKMIGFNFAGLKGRAPSGGGVRLWTHEHQAGRRTRVLRTFRAYPSAEAGAADYVRLLHDRYPKAMRAAKRGSVIDFAQALEDGGYFTDNPEAYRRALRSLWMEYVRKDVARRAGPGAATG